MRKREDTPNESLKENPGNNKVLISIGGYDGENVVEEISGGELRKIIFFGVIRLYFGIT